MTKLPHSRFKSKKSSFYVFVFSQVYTRSVIDPIPAPDSDAASRADKLKKKGGKMTDEEIMEKLSKFKTCWK